MSDLKNFKSDASRYGGNEIDLRAEMSTIMRVHGHWGLLRRKVKERHCGCWNDQTSEARSDCRKCLGSGFAFVDHIVRMRKQVLFQMSEDQQPAGRIDPSLVKIWVQYHVRPDRGDFLAELAQDEASRQRNFQIQPVVPFQISQLYDIQDVADHRELGGRLEFFTCMCLIASYGDVS